MWVNYSIDPKKFFGHMLNIKLVERSYKMSFKVLSVKPQNTAVKKLTRGGGHNVPPPSKIGLRLDSILNISQKYSKHDQEVWQLVSIMHNNPRKFFMLCCNL